MRVLEAYGFGSFFRGKDRPHDVDLLLRRSMEDTNDFRLFSALLDKVSHGGHSGRFETPQAALLHAFDERYSNLLPGLIDVHCQRALFEQWIEGYTWKMLFTSDMVQEFTLRSSTEIARRFVKRNLPNLNISWWIGPEEPAEKSGLRAGFVVLLWSREKPDIRSNVEESLQEDQRQGPILEDLARFDQDLFGIEIQIDLVKRAFGRLLRTPKSRKRADDYFEWLRAWTKRQRDINPAALDRAIFWDDLMAQEDIVEKLGLKYPSPSYDGMSVGELSKLAEERRSRLKPLRHYLDVAQEAIRLLAWYKSNQRVNERNPSEFLVAHFLHDKSREWWKKGRPVLADLGMNVPQHRIDHFYEQWSRPPLEDVDDLPD